MPQFKGIVGYHVTMSQNVHRIIRNGLVPTRGLRSRTQAESRSCIRKVTFVTCHFQGVKKSISPSIYSGVDSRRQGALVCEVRPEITRLQRLKG
jgi:hypothetical protein